MTDTAGKTYLDFSSGIGVTNLAIIPCQSGFDRAGGQDFASANLYHNQLQEDVADLLIGDKDYLAFFL